MDNKPIEESRNERIARRSGMYIALVVCILALILGFWSAINRTARLSASQDITRQSVVISTNQQVKQAEKNQTKVEDDTKTQQNDAAKESETVSPVAEFFTMPVGGEIIKYFSKTELQYSKTYLDWRLHSGIDIAADKGTEIHAAGNGKVKDVYTDDLLGGVIEIDHGNGIVAYYCGVGTPLVKEGQIVVAGKTIGAVSEVPCESVDQYHIHFAVMVNGEWADPLTTLKISQ